MVRRSSHDVIGRSDFGCAMDEVSFGVKLVKALYHEENEHGCALTIVSSIDVYKSAQFS